MDHPSVRNDWVYFVDADEWVSSELASEITEVVRSTCYPGSPAAYSQRFRMVFLGTWIRHSGWYGGRITRLVDRRRSRWDVTGVYVDRVIVDGPVGTLRHDLVDQDLKGLASWMSKHVQYANLEASRRLALTGSNRRRVMSRPSSMPLVRAIAKEVIFPRVPCKPLALFIYMFLVRAGWREGRVGLTFCLLHAWHEHNVGRLVFARSRGLDPGPRLTGRGG